MKGDLGGVCSPDMASAIVMDRSCLRMKEAFSGELVSFEMVMSQLEVEDGGRRMREKGQRKRQEQRRSIRDGFR